LLAASQQIIDMGQCQIPLRNFQRGDLSTLMRKFIKAAPENFLNILIVALIVVVVAVPVSPWALATPMFEG
jgi:hypothetical protein